MRISEVGDATVVSGNGQRGGNVSVLDPGQCSRAGQVFFDGLSAGLVITDVREQLHKKFLLNDMIPLPYEKWKLLSIGILPIISV